MGTGWSVLGGQLWVYGEKLPGTVYVGRVNSDHFVAARSIQASQRMGDWETCPVSTGPQKID